MDFVYNIIEKNIWIGETTFKIYSFSSLVKAKSFYDTLIQKYESNSRISNYFITEQVEFCDTIYYDEKEPNKNYAVEIYENPKDLTFKYRWTFFLKSHPSADTCEIILGKFSLNEPDGNLLYNGEESPQIVDFYFNHQIIQLVAFLSYSKQRELIKFLKQQIPQIETVYTSCARLKKEAFIDVVNQSQSVFEAQEKINYFKNSIQDKIIEFINNNK